MFRSRVGAGFEWAAIALLMVTALTVPWVIGGVIPQARLILQVGAGLALVSAAIAAALRDRPQPMLTRGAFLMVCGAGLGLWQLLPVHSHLISRMEHAVHAGAPEWQVPVDQDGDSPATNSPGDTRTAVALLLALAAVNLTSVDVLGDTGRVRTVLWLTTTAGAITAGVVLLRGTENRFEQAVRSFMLHDSEPYAGFVNPNTAAGWLCISAGCALALICSHFMAAEKRDQDRMPPPKSDRHRGYSYSAGAVIERLMRLVAELKPSTVVAGLCLPLILAGVAATRSRSGIAAAAISIIFALTLMMRRRRILVILPLVLLMSGSVALLAALQLQEDVKSELATLSDPLREMQSRFLHWKDAVVVARDLPIAGGGLGSYRQTVGPYLRYYRGTRFSVADNAYLQLLVEGGAVALLLFLLVGFEVSRMALKCRGESTAARSSSDRSHAMLHCIVLAVYCGSQAVSAVFDFGPALPAAASLGMILLGAAASPAATRSSHRFRITGLRRTGIVAVRLALAAAVLAMVPDLWASSKIYREVVAGTHLLRRPLATSEGEATAAVYHRLVTSLEERPDDADGLMTAVRLREAMFRYEVLRELDADRALSGIAFENAWQRLSPLGLYALHTEFRQHPEDASLTHLKDVISRARLRENWSSDVANLVLHVPLEPGGQYYLATCDGPDRQPAQLSVLVHRAEWAEPNHARRLFVMGAYCFHAGLYEDARELWQQSLLAASDHRLQIMSIAVTREPAITVVAALGPTSFSEAVRLAHECDIPALQRQLRRRADELWNVVQATPDPRAWHSRALQLMWFGTPEVALDWLDQCIVQYPDDVPLRILRAEQREKAGQKQGAIEDWLAVEVLDPRSTLPNRSISRLTDFARGPFPGPQEEPRGKADGQREAPDQD